MPDARLKISDSLPPRTPGVAQIVGILNLTPDSFSDGGKYLSPSAAIARAEQMVAEGAVMIDLGGQSTRPGYTEISVEEEIARVVPIITALRAQLSVSLSIDTYKPAVARAAFAAGAHILNDIYGLQRHPELATLAAEFHAPVIAMHHDAALRDQPGDPLPSVLRFFEKTLSIADAAGIPRNQLILDPGIGFGKTQSQNLALLARLDELRVFGCPLLLGASRKSVIAHVLGKDLPPDERLEGTLATTALAVWQGVDYLRVHDIRANARTAQMAAALRQSRNG